MDTCINQFIRWPPPSPTFASRLATVDDFSTHTSSRMEQHFERLPEAVSYQYCRPILGRKTVTESFEPANKRMKDLAHNHYTLSLK